VKFGPNADRMFFTPEGLEQATRPAVAARHAARFAGAGVGSVADLCCGIGGDLQQLAGAVDRVLGVDRDPVTVAVAQANVDASGQGARVEIRCDDVTAVDLAGWDGVFIDPSRRRSGGRRTFDPRGYSPSYDVVLGLAARVPATGAKLAPGVPHEVLPADAEAEWVSDGGDVVECALWFGPLASGVRRRATLLPSGATLAADVFTPGEVGPVRRYLYEPDGAVIRAGLVAEAAALVDGNLVDPTIAYVTAEALVATPFMTAYEITDVLPFGLKRLRALLRSRGVGRLTVKKRGSAITPESLRQQLRLSGPEEATIVLTRVAGAATVLLVQRI
jgi:SAM-dependent methyltransferase